MGRSNSHHMLLDVRNGCWLWELVRGNCCCVGGWRSRGLLVEDSGQAALHVYRVVGVCWQTCCGCGGRGGWLPLASPNDAAVADSGKGIWLLARWWLLLCGFILGMVGLVPSEGPIVEQRTSSRLWWLVASWGSMGLSCCGGCRAVFAMWLVGWRGQRSARVWRAWVGGLHPWVVVWGLSWVCCWCCGGCVGGVLSDGSPCGRAGGVGLVEH